MKVTELAARVQAFAAARGITPRAARDILIARGLDATEQRADAGRRTGATMTAEQRAARARFAALVRHLPGTTHAIRGQFEGTVRYSKLNHRRGLCAVVSITCPHCRQPCEAIAPSIVSVVHAVEIPCPTCRVVLVLELTIGQADR